MPDQNSYAFGIEWASELEADLFDSLESQSCLELIPENFFESQFDYFLEALGQVGTPVAVHGVGLSLGSMEPLKERHLEEALEVGARVNMVNFSEHLSLTDVAGVDLDALTPLAWTEEVVDGVCRKIDRIQSRIKVPFLIENVANRFVVPCGDYSEPEFINRILRKTGCGLLLDVTNVYTNSVNFEFDPYAWIDRIDARSVGLVHLAGGAFDPDGFLMDSHDQRVTPEAWDLYRYVVAKAPPFMTIIERTGNFPRFEELMDDLDFARSITAERAPKKGAAS